MTQLYNFLIKVFLMSSIASAVHAAEVYRTVDESGNIVFSDKKTHDAETINVQPNVIDLDIPDVPVTSAQGKANKPASNTPTGGQQEMSGWNSNNGGNLRRRARTQTNGEGVNRPRATPGGKGGGR